MIARRSVTALGLLALLSALPAVATDDAGPQALDGLWSGTFDINGRGEYGFTALYLDGVVSAYSVDTNVVYRGTVTGDAQTYRSDMSIFLRDGTQLATVQLNGTVSNQTSRITARYRTTGQDTGTLTLDYDPLFEKDVDPVELAGLWEYTSSKLSISFNVDRQGKIEGTDSVGCNYYGNLAQARPGVNAMKAKLEMASCGTADGHYSGMAHVADMEAPGDTLHLHVTSDHFGLYYPLTRIASAQ